MKRITGLFLGLLCTTTAIMPTLVQADNESFFNALAYAGGMTAAYRAGEESIRYVFHYHPGKATIVCGSLLVAYVEYNWYKNRQKTQQHSVNSGWFQTRRHSN